MWLRENLGIGYCCREEGVYKVQSYGLSPLLTTRKTKIRFNIIERPAVILNGITHYNTFNTKPFDPQHPNTLPKNPKKKIKTRTVSLTPVRLKKSLKHPPKFLPYLNPLKINLLSKLKIRRNPSKNPTTSKDESLSTDDLDLF